MSSPTSSKIKTAIEMINIHKSFRGGRDKVLDGIDLNFPEGKLTYILGPSGTGKSVLIKHILGLLKPDEGQVLVHGIDMSQLSGRELAKARSVFGMLFQNAALFDDLTVFDNVAFPLYEHTKLSKSEIEDRVSRSLKLLDMNKGYDKYPNELSGGMKKRVGLARAIIREPSILLYDEPTTGLDPVTRMTVDDLIARLKEELALTSVVISHDIPSALRLGDQVVFLHGGKAIFHDEPSHFVKADHEVIRKFLDAEHRTVDSFASLA